jgi:hypothetical protein
MALIGANLAVGHPLAASESVIVVGDTVRTPAGALEVASIAFARAIAEVSGEGMTLVFAANGIRLHLDDDAYAGLSSRQAVASIREFLRGYDAGVAVVSRTALVEGTSNRGFAEVLWVARMVGTSHEMRRTLFIGLHRDGDAWRVDEVRFLR